MSDSHGTYYCGEVMTCPSGMFLDKEYDWCYDCELNCDYCTDEYTCQQCKDGYKFMLDAKQSVICGQECRNHDMYYDIDSDDCWDCKEGCL